MSSEKQVIPIIQSPAEKRRKERVAAYCRVSTEFEEQESSYETQVAHYTSYINGNPEWEMVEVYADNGLSGTRTAKREAFNRMIADCEAGRIDMIITKSISRFARNTVDCLKYTRKLKELNIAVFFEKENINTLDAKGEVLMTIMAALAQQESESLSANVRLGIQFRNQQGKVQINHNWFLGYTKDESGKLVIVPEEAEVVRRIYREYLEGASFVKIRRGLEADGILNGAKHARWHETNIKQILTNEKYTGDSLWQKTYTSDTLPATRHKNTGEHEQYYAVGTHPPIIPRKTFDQVQTLMQKRSVGQAVTHGRLCVRMRCSCGSRIRAKQVNGRWYWCCCRHDEKGDCAIKPVPERRRMKPSAASTISSSIRASPFWSRCSRPSGRSVIADCSGARTSFPSTKKYPNSPVRIERWPSSSKTASLILTFLYPKATS